MAKVWTVIKGLSMLIVLGFVTGLMLGTAWGAFKLASRFVQSLL